MRLLPRPRPASRWRQLAGLVALLLALAGGAGAAQPQRPAEGGMAATARAAIAELLPPLNADIRDGAWIEGTGVLLTPSLALTADGKIEVQALVCRGDRVPDARFVAACRGGRAGGVARRLLVDPAAIDHTSIRVHAGTNGSVEALFACRGTAACISLPDRAKGFTRSSLVCNDVAACDRVAVNLAALVDLAAPAPAAGEDPGRRALQAALTRLNAHMRRGFAIERGTTATVLLNPGAALKEGSSLEVQRSLCTSGRASIDDMHLVSDCVGGGFEGVTVDRRTIAIDLGAIDPASLRVASATGAGGAKGNWITFGCRSGVSCIAGTDPSESHRDGRLVCNDGPDCRHLVDDLGTLIRLVGLRAKGAN